MATTKTKAVRRIQFCSGHRVHKHESKCNNIHGHNYVLYLYAEAYGLDSLGRVIDFSVLKENMGGWIDKYWDHGFIAYKEDKEVVQLMQVGEDSWNQKVYLLDNNPTAENMAEFLLNDICPKLFFGTGITITKIELYETENCKVEVSIND